MLSQTMATACGGDGMACHVPGDESLLIFLSIPGVSESLPTPSDEPDVIALLPRVSSVLWHTLAHSSHVPSRVSDVRPRTSRTSPILWQWIEGAYDGPSIVCRTTGRGCEVTSVAYEGIARTWCITAEVRHVGELASRPRALTSHPVAEVAFEDVLESLAMAATESKSAITAVFRIESPELIAGLTRIVRDVGRAEELAQEAFVVPLERWPESGVHDPRGAWLLATAKNRGIDHVRLTKRGARKLEELGRDTDEVWLAADEALLLCVRDLVASWVVLAQRDEVVSRTGGARGRGDHAGRRSASGCTTARTALSRRRDAQARKPPPPCGEEGSRSSRVRL